MSKLFEEYLVKEVGIAQTRAPELAQAMDKLHNALCQMDTENLEKVHQVGLVELMREFCKIEEVREVIPTFKPRIGRRP